MMVNTYDPRCQLCTNYPRALQASKYENRYSSARHRSRTAVTELWSQVARSA